MTRQLKLSPLTAATAFLVLTTACASAPGPAATAANGQLAPAATQPAAPATAPVPPPPAPTASAPATAAAPANQTPTSASVTGAVPAAPSPPASGTPATTAEAPPGTAGKQAPTEGLLGLRLEVPCHGEKFGENTECHWDTTLLQTADPQWKLKKEIVRTFAGEPGVTYDVKVRVRGVVEPKNFTGGKIDKEHFQRGGTPVSDDYNFYSIKVSDPAETYTVNRHQKKTSHFVFPIDYTVTIPVRGGATITVGAYDRNDISIANHKSIVIPKIPPAPAAFDGQFFQVDVLDIRKQR